MKGLNNFKFNYSSDRGFTTYTFEVVSANVLGVEVGTTGYCGGDSGHGGKTYIKIENLASTDMTVNKTEKGFELLLGGDCELDTIIEAFETISTLLHELK